MVLAPKFHLLTMAASGSYDKSVLVLFSKVWFSLVLRQFYFQLHNFSGHLQKQKYVYFDILAHKGGW